MNEILDVFPYLRVRDADSAIRFYTEVFGAIEVMRLVEPGGRVGHAELKFGATTVMLSDEYPEHNIHAPTPGQPIGSAIHLHVGDVDALVRRAIQAGAVLTMPPTDQFYGERSAKIVDPFGHEWLLGSHIEEVPPEEMQRRFAALFDGT